MLKFQVAEKGKTTRNLESSRLGTYTKLTGNISPDSVFEWADTIDKAYVPAISIVITSTLTSNTLVTSVAYAKFDKGPEGITSALTSPIGYYTTGQSCIRNDTLFDISKLKLMLMSLCQLVRGQKD